MLARVVQPQVQHERPTGAAREPHAVGRHRAEVRSGQRDSLRVDEVDGQDRQVVRRAEADSLRHLTGAVEPRRHASCRDAVGLTGGGRRTAGVHRREAPHDVPDDDRRNDDGRDVAPPAPARASGRVLPDQLVDRHAPAPFAARREER